LRLSLRDLGVLRASAVYLAENPTTAETLRPLRLRRELKLHQYLTGAGSGIRVIGHLSFDLVIFHLKAGSRGAFLNGK